jgi:hypothetical protein
MNDSPGQTYFPFYENESSAKSRDDEKTTITLTLGEAVRLKELYKEMKLYEAKETWSLEDLDAQRSIAAEFAEIMGDKLL